MQLRHHFKHSLAFLKKDCAEHLVCSRDQLEVALGLLGARLAHGLLVNPSEAVAAVWRPVTGTVDADVHGGGIAGLHDGHPRPVVGPHDVDEGHGAAGQHKQEEAEEGGKYPHLESDCSAR